MGASALNYSTRYRHSKVFNRHVVTPHYSASQLTLIWTDRNYCTVGKRDYYGFIQVDGINYLPNQRP